MFTAQPIILGRILLQFGLMYAPEGKKTFNSSDSDFE